MYFLHFPQGSDISVLFQCWLPARLLAEDSFDERFDVDSSGEIIRLHRFYPWKEHLFDIEKERELPGKIKYCLYEVCDGIALLLQISLVPL